METVTYSSSHHTLLSSTQRKQLPTLHLTTPFQVPHKGNSYVLSILLHPSVFHTKETVMCSPSYQYITPFRVPYKGNSYVLISPHPSESYTKETVVPTLHLTTPFWVLYKENSYQLFISPHPSVFHTCKQNSYVLSILSHPSEFYTKEAVTYSSSHHTLLSSIQRKQLRALHLITPFRVLYKGNSYILFI